MPDPTTTPAAQATSASGATPLIPLPPMVGVEIIWAPGAAPDGSGADVLDVTGILEHGVPLLLTQPQQEAAVGWFLRSVGGETAQAAELLAAALAGFQMARELLGHVIDRAEGQTHADGKPLVTEGWLATARNLIATQETAPPPGPKLHL